MYFQNMFGSLLEACDFVLSEGRKPEKLRPDKGTDILTNHFDSILKRKTFDVPQQTTDQRQV